MEASFMISLLLTVFYMTGIFANIPVSIEENDINIYCDGKKLESLILNHSGPIVTKTRAKFYQCPPPASYFDVLASLNVNVKNVQELELIEVPFNNQLYASQFKEFEGLNLTTFRLTYAMQYGNRSLPPYEDFMKPLTSLTELEIHDVDLSHIPESIRLTKIKLLNAVMPEWRQCSQLKELIIQEVDVSEIKLEWLRTCSQLSYLHMEHIKYLTPQILKETLIGLTGLITLKIRNCDLKVLDQNLHLFENFHKLEQLDLSHNSLTNVRIAPLISLINLELSHNNFDNRHVVMKLMDVQIELRNLSLAFNPLLDMCSVDQNTTGVFPSHPKLERFNLISTGTTGLCFHEMEALVHLDLSNSRITELWFKFLPVTRKLYLEVNLMGNNIKKVYFNKLDFEELQNKTNSGLHRTEVTLLITLSLECDCQNAWLSRALREDFGLTVTDATCGNGEKLEKVSMEQLECDRYKCTGAARNCTCRKSWHDSAVDADCRYADVHKMPREKHLRKVLAPKNRIHNLTADDFPDSLVWVDVSGNQLSQIDAITLETIFNVSSRHVCLAGNPITCDCDRRQLIEMLQQHLEQVEDSDKLKCWGSDEMLSTVESATLCVRPESSQLKTLLITAGTLMALLILAAVLYYRFEYQLKILLYSHGYTLCMRAEDLDADRIYDVFLSFAHGDEHFVMEEFLPRLEEGPHCYKVCIHTRDWVVGDWIPAQISRSVEQSRRTIVILSEHYLASSWGMLEFRTAYEAAMTENRPRIVVVTLDDVVNDERLDSVLRTYLRNNTLVRRDDKLFWYKLRYALPHRRNNLFRQDQNPENNQNMHLAAITNQSAPRNPSCSESPKELCCVSRDCCCLQ